MKLYEIITLLATVLVAGWFSAFITQALKQAKWPSAVKLLLSAVIAALVALAAAWISGDVLHFVTIYQTGNLTAGEVMVFFTAVFTSGATWYQFYFKNSTWAQNLALWPNR